MSTAAGDRQNAQMAFLHVSRELHRACDASEEVSDKLRFAVGAEKRQLLQQLKVLRQKRTLLLEYLLVMCNGIAQVRLNGNSSHGAVPWCSWTACQSGCP